MKKLSFIIVAFLSLFIGGLNAKAASASVSVLSSTNKVVVGKTFKITVKVSSAVALGAWEYTLNYDSSVVSLVSSDVSLHYAGYGNGSTKTKSYAYTFKALKSGTAKFSVSKTSVIDWNENIMSVTNGTRNVSIITQADLEASYSKNNNLSNLTVDNYELSPKFDKDVTTYEVTVPATVTKIKINATKADSKSSILGTGEFDVSEGLNAFTIKVTAQNGNIKNYLINVNVEDMNPIKVKIDNKEYVVVKRTDLVECPSTYLENIVTISETTIPACSNEISKYTLIALKDSEGNIKLFNYNASNNSYEKYVELTFKGLIFTPLTFKEQMEGFEPITTKINGEEVKGYALKEDSKFILVYGKNIETGKENIYVYDKEEQTLQRYNDEHINVLKKDVKDYMLITIIFAGGLFVTLIAFVVTITKKKRKKIKIEESIIENKILEEKPTKKAKSTKKQ